MLECAGPHHPLKHPWYLEQTGRVRRRLARPPGTSRGQRWREHVIAQRAAGSVEADDVRVGNRTRVDALDLAGEVEDVAELPREELDLLGVELQPRQRCEALRRRRP